MPETLVLFEHQCTVGFNWTNRELAQLSKLNSALDAPVLNAVIKNGKRELQATEQVGTVRLGKRVVNILPKIHRSETSSDDKTIARQASENLLYLLSLAGKLDIGEAEISALCKSKLDWFEILTDLFARHLLAEWCKGATRGYQIVEDDSPVLKGKWRFAEQLRRSTVKPGSPFCSTIPPPTIA